MLQRNPGFHAVRPTGSNVFAIRRPDNIEHLVNILMVVVDPLTTPNIMELRFSKKFASFKLQSIKSALLQVVLVYPSIV